MSMPHHINGRQPTAEEATDYKAREAVGKHLGLPDGALNDWQVQFDGRLMDSHSLPSDPVFGPRRLFIVQVGREVHVLRVMTSPLRREFSVHEEAVL